MKRHCFYVTSCGQIKFVLVTSAHFRWKVKARVATHSMSFKGKAIARNLCANVTIKKSEWWAFDDEQTTKDQMDV